MNLSAPHCPRCAGARMLHVREVRDHVLGLGGGDWLPRPVGLVPGPPHPRTLFGDPVQPIGRFETLTCRSCGYTLWYAFDWELLQRDPRRHFCVECLTETPHVLRDAVENVSSGFEQPRLTRGGLGWEGFLAHDLCVRCGRASWLGRDYERLGEGLGLHHHLCEDAQRPCLRCRGTDAIIVDVAREYDAVAVPVTVAPRRFLGLFSYARSSGVFSLRLCRPCASIEWYAREPERLQPDVAAGAFAIGESQIGSVQGPYR